MKQCYLWGKNKKWKEKSYCFTHPALSSINSQPKGKNGDIEKNESHTGKKKQNKKKQEKVKKIKLS